MSLIHLTTEQYHSDLNVLSKQQLIQQVEQQRIQNLILKEKLKYTQSFIIEPTTNKNTKDEKLYNSTFQLLRNKEIHLQNLKKQQKTPITNQNHFITMQQIQKQQRRTPNIFNNRPNQQTAHILNNQNQHNIQSNKPLPINVNKLNQLQLKTTSNPRLCQKMHALHLFKSSGKVNCIKCSLSCKMQAWGCMGCNYYQCIKCQPYPRDHCPYNEILRPTMSLNFDYNKLLCSVCETQLKGNGLSCVSCNYNLCQKCLQ